MTDIVYPPATVFVTRGAGIAARLIRLGAALTDKPNLGNHVVGLHHYTDGIPWGIEGRPGGVGWVDMRKYLRSGWTISNLEQVQEMGNDRRIAIAKSMELALGTKYDWQAIGSDVFESLGIRDMFLENWHGQGAPGQVVCSSLYAWAYMANGEEHPDLGSERRCKPTDWSEFIYSKGWRK